MSGKMLFSGTPDFFGGLTNEKELAEVCPQEFQKDNPWSNYAHKLFFHGGNIENWEWRSKDDEIKSKQLACFRGLFRTFNLSLKDKEAVGGWMLSEMLMKVPEYIPAR